MAKTTRTQIKRKKSNVKLPNWLNFFNRLSSRRSKAVAFLLAFAVIGTMLSVYSFAANTVYRAPFRSVHNLRFSNYDAGMDFSGTGTVYPIGTALVVNVHAPSNSGWGQPAVFISYKLLDGAYKGRYVYVAEACTPAVSVGHQYSNTHPLCTMTNHVSYWRGIRESGIETGWAQKPRPGVADLAAPGGGRQFQRDWSRVGIKL